MAFLFPSLAISEIRIRLLFLHWLAALRVIMITSVLWRYFGVKRDKLEGLDISSNRTSLKLNNATRRTKAPGPRRNQCVSTWGRVKAKIAVSTKSMNRVRPPLRGRVYR